LPVIDEDEPDGLLEAEADADGLVLLLDEVEGLVLP